ncbi:putative Zn-dependent protease with MMP-like domain [Albidovulum inexpectatum]|uniref:Putative Zn-dependent protease with MMP-like domain n=1 Tax=Albidovulum inexpectatum TaxID=196587 RepID=A0A2S5JKS8_9RHOB|nr:metallopeptidase family protein [Albidovulum inexpectatum]PPB82094.1 putative Zn-dependent protease with MMP-like domain [Albidovulum inexpectatum]
MNDWLGRTAPDVETIERMARAAVDELPPQFRAPAREVMIRVEEFPPEELLDEMNIESPFELTGLYDGIPLTQKSVMDVVDRPDMIWLFRRPILDEWAERGDVTLGQLVAHIMVHELAHHFGWTDEQIARIDRWWE